MESYTHRTLPHRHREGARQFITWRCFDAMPTDLLVQIQRETEELPAAERKSERWSRIERTLDSGLGNCFLTAKLAGRVVEAHLQSTAEKMFDLHEYVIMPNHVHVLITPDPGVSLSKLMQIVKGGSAFLANKHLNRSGTFWQYEYFDRMIRDEQHYDRVAAHIRYNPVKAGHCKKEGEWVLSSARGKELGVREDRALYGEPYDPFLDVG